jgi:hypothetical protein
LQQVGGFLDYTLSVGIRKLAKASGPALPVSGQAVLRVSPALEGGDGVRDSTHAAIGKTVPLLPKTEPFPDGNKENPSISGLVSRTGLLAAEPDGKLNGEEVYLVGIRFPFRIERFQSGWCVSIPYCS